MAGDLVITFEGAFEPLRRAAYRAAYRLLGDRATAEDVAAEALARAYARWSSVADHAQPWVIRVATNLALDVGRRRATASGIGSSRSRNTLITPSRRCRAAGRVPGRHAT